MLLHALLALTIAGCHGDLQFATYYQSHMVLQRGPQQSVVWGHATKIGDTVTVKVSGQAAVTATVVKDSAGKGMWKVKLPAVTGVTAHTVTASSSEGSVTINDVLFGDVWICSGQSNMGFTTGHLVNHTAEIAASLALTDIRIFRTSLIQSHTALTDFGSKGITTHWTKPTTATMNSFSAVCWLFGEYLHADRKYPIGLVDSAWGGTPIEVWSSPDALTTCSHHTKRGPTEDSILWNSMINPLLGMTFYGAIWYQGENNAGQPSKYSCQFPAMINDWRSKFNKASLGETSVDFPFGFVQLAAFRHNQAIGGFPALRYAQTVDQGYVPNSQMKNTFMAVAMDLPDFKSPYGSIHPRFKHDVASRLVLGARAVAYNEKNVMFQGPFPKTVTNSAAAHTMTITYEHGPIAVRTNSGFDVCCSTNTKCQAHDTWTAAPIKSHTDSTVVLSTSGCAGKNAVGVRYAWRESPCDFKNCAIYEQNTDLPAPPYLKQNGFDNNGQIIG